MKIIDCRNLDCPAPVITVKKALESFREIQVLLDDGAPRENVTLFARNRGFQVTEELREQSGWCLTIVAASNQHAAHQTVPGPGPCVFLITSDRIGDGSEELGRLLMKNFIHTLLDTDRLPDRMIFLNSGVYLTCEGSDVLEGLLKLSGMGVEIVSCGLCLDYYTLKDKLRAGSVTNMLSTAESLLSAASIIKL